MQHVQVRLDLGQQFQCFARLGEHFDLTSRLARRVDDTEPQLATNGQVARAKRIVRNLSDDLQQQCLGLLELVVLQVGDGSIPLIEQFECRLPSQFLRRRSRPSGTAFRWPRLRIETSHNEEKGHEQCCRDASQQRCNEPQVARRVRLGSLFHRGVILRLMCLFENSPRAWGG